MSSVSATPDATAYIKFFAPVDGNSANALMNVVDQKLRDGFRHLVLLISTPGGSVFHGLSVHNFLAGLPVQLETHNFGQIDSIGLVLYVAGSRRLCVPDARFLLHTVATQFAAGVTLEEPQVEERLKSLKIDTSNIATVIGKATGKDSADILRAMTARTTLNAEEARAFGIVHEIKRELLPAGADLSSINLA